MSTVTHVDDLLSDPPVSTILLHSLSNYTPSEAELSMQLLPLRSGMHCLTVSFQHHPSVADSEILKGAGDISPVVIYRKCANMNFACFIREKATSENC